MSEDKKMSVQEKMRQQLEKKKAAQANGKTVNNSVAGTNQRMQSQQHKKTSSTRRKMGS